MAINFPNSPLTNDTFVSGTTTYTWDGTVWRATTVASPSERAITYVIDGGGSAITTGSKGYIEVPFACTITGWTIVADVSGSIVVDVKRATYSGFPTTTTIAGSEKPTLSTAQKNQDLALSTWTGSGAIADGDVLEFVVDSASTISLVTVSLSATIP